MSAPMRLADSRIRIALAVAIALAAPAVGRAALLLYEPFDYAGSGSVTLNGQGATNTPGFDPAGTWSAFTNGTKPITVYNQGTLSGLNFSSGTANAYVGTATNLPTSGGYMGPGGTNSTDHMIVWRTLAPSVISSFVDGSTTWFSFVSVRAYDANPAGMKLALGKGRLQEDRGQLASGEAIGGGGGLGSSVLNSYKVYPQFWDATTGSPGETTGTFSNYDVGGVQANSSGSAHVVSAPYFPYSDYPLPTGQTAGLDSMLLNNSAGVQANGARNIVVGKIEWHDGTTPDVISVVNFWDNGALTESAFASLITAQPNLSSANWPTARQPVLDQSKFDTLSLAGGKWFADEVRLATTFNEVVGISVVPEPSTLAALLPLAAGLAAAAGLRCRRRSRRTAAVILGSMLVASLLVSALLLATSIGGSASAADFTWDNGALASSRDPPLTPSANGIWSVTRTVDTVLVPGSYNWTVFDAGSQQTLPAQWTNGNTAVFGPADPSTPWAAGIDAAVTAAGLTFNGPATVANSNGSAGTDSLRFTAAGASMTANVATGVTATVSATILPNDTTVDQSNLLFKTGAGTLVLAGTTRLTTTISSGTKGNKTSYFTVNGGGTLQITGKFISTNDTASYNQASCPTSFIGNASSGNTVRVTGSGTMWTNAITFGGASGGTSFDNNSLILSAAGSATTPTWTNFGASPQVNMVSSGNLLKVEAGAYLRENGGAGTATWTIGTTAGNDGNSIVVDGAGATLAKTNGAVVVGAAGSSNFLTVRSGGTFNGGSKLEVGTNGGDDNYHLVTGSGSAQNAGFGSNNTWLKIGVTTGSLRNSLRVENGAVLYQGGNTNDRTNGVGWVTGANDNFIKVSGAGSIYKFIHLTPLVIGGQAGLVSSVATISNGGSGNHLDVLEGGKLDLDNYSGVDPNVSSGSTYLALAGTGSTFTLGNGILGTGNAVSTVVLGKLLAYGSGLGLRNADSVLRINAGRVVAGSTLVSDSFSSSSSYTLVSGNGSIVLDGPSYFSIPAGGVSAIVSTPISGSGSLTKEDAGTLLLSNAANSYTGNTTISAGTLKITLPFLSATSTVTIGRGALIDLSFPVDNPVNVVGALVVDGETMPEGDYTWESTTSRGGIPFITGAGTLRVVQPVPEPGSLPLAAGGAVLAVSGLRWRRRLR